MVILLHGIGQASWAMAFAEAALKKSGYKTLNLSYPSRKHTIDDLSDWLKGELTKHQIWEKSEKVHFVAHSMGGLVTATYLEKHKKTFPSIKTGRVVMMGTPHGGSEVADFLETNPLYKWIFGPAGQELTTHARQKNKAQPWYDLGIIAGSHSWAYPLGMFCIKEENDGCVSISSTKLDGMKDHLVLPSLHGFMG